MNKTIVLSIPYDNKIPDIISSFSPEENYLMLNIGAECLREGRNAIANLSQNEIYNKIKEETKEQINKLEMDILIEKELGKKMEERINAMYNTQISQMKKHIELLSTQIKTNELENKECINKEVNKVRHNYDLLLVEKDKQNQLNREVFDKASILVSKNISKSSVSIGDDGENIFEYLTDTFKDFTEYKIENKSKQGHKGDFHLFFQEFNVLVDLKNYSGSVQKKELVKIENDLTINDNMKFAWLVSLNTPICEQNRFPITCKWINTDVGLKCILFINNLLSYKEPTNLLRQAWYMCYELNKYTTQMCKEDIELEKYKGKELKQKKQIKNLQERTNEIRRNINTLYNILKHMDNELLEMMTEVTDEFVNNKSNLNNKINIWWNTTIHYTNNNNKLTSTDIWNKFKKENKEYINENTLTIDKFKEILTTIVNSANYIEKNKKGVIEFIGYSFKET